MVKVMILDGKKWKIPGEWDMRYDDNDRQSHNCASDAARLWC